MGLIANMLMHIDIEIGKHFTGGRRYTDLHQDITEKAAAFRGLPADVTRWDLLRLVKRVAKSYGLTSCMLQHLEFLMEHTQDQDWQAYSRPIVYSTLLRMSQLRGLSCRQLRNLENQLLKRKMITWKDSPNHRRYGHRNESGRIAEAFGVDLSPLALLYKEMCEVAAEQDMQYQQWQHARKQVSAAKRTAKGLLAEAFKRQLPVAEALGIAYMAADEKIISTTTIEDMKKVGLQMRQLIDQLKAALNAPDLSLGHGNPAPIPDPDKPLVNKDNSQEESDNISAKGEKYFPLYSTLHTLPSNNLEDCNPLLVDKRSAAPASQAGRSMVGYADTGQTAQQEKQGSIVSQISLFEAGEMPQEAVKPEISEEETGIDRLLPEDIVRAAGRIFSANLIQPADGKPWTWEHIIAAGDQLAGWFGMRRAAWEAAGQTIGYKAAAVCVMLGDARRFDPLNPVDNVPGFVHGCVRKARLGELNLLKSVNYLQAKAKFDA